MAQATQTQNICLQNWCLVMPRWEVGNRGDTWRLPGNTGNDSGDRFLDSDKLVKFDLLLEVI